MKTDRFRMTAVVMMCAVLALAAAHPASAFIRIARQADASSPVVQAQLAELIRFRETCRASTKRRSVQRLCSSRPGGR